MKCTRYEKSTSGGVFFSNYYFYFLNFFLRQFMYLIIMINLLLNSAFISIFLNLFFNFFFIFLRLRTPHSLFSEQPFLNKTSSSGLPVLRVAWEESRCKTRTEDLPSKQTLRLYLPRNKHK